MPEAQTADLEKSRDVATHAGGRNAPGVGRAATPSLDSVAADPACASGLDRATLLSLHAAAVRALAALEGPLLSLALGKQERPIKERRLLDAAQAAEMVNVPESWIRDMARQGKLSSIRLGHYVRFRSEDLDTFIASHARAA